MEERFDHSGEDASADPDPPGGAALQHHAPHPYHALDGDGVIRAVNDAWVDRLGYDRPAVIGQWFGEFLTPASRTEFESAFQECKSAGGFSGLELSVTHAAGHTISVEVDGNAEFDDDRQFHRAHCQFVESDQDEAEAHAITELPGWDGSVDATAERLQLAIEGAQLGVWDWNMETGEVRRDELLTTMLGYSPSEMGDRLTDWERLVHPEGEQRHNEALAEHIENRTEYYQCDYRMRTSDDDWKWVRTMGKVVERDAEGTPIRAVGIHMDIDEQKRNYERLQQTTEQLEALNRVVRHDIRNEMNVIYGWAQELDRHVDEAGTTAVQRVLDASQHIVELTEVAREFVESLGTGEPVDLKPIDLRKHLHSEVSKQRENNPDVEFVVEGDIPSVEVRANEMLSSVFRNLLVNAVDHNDSSSPKVRIATEPDGDTVVVRIADNGPGVPDESKDVVFGKGEKGLESAGTGIGLHLVNRLVEGYGGDVWVEDSDLGGAAFVVELPRG